MMKSNFCKLATLPNATSPRLRKKLKEQEMERKNEILSQERDKMRHRITMLEGEVAYLKQLLVMKYDDRILELLDNPQLGSSKID